MYIPFTVLDTFFNGVPAIQAPEPCTARGTGLVNGVVGKRCRFNVHVVTLDNLDLYLEIRGTNEERLQEQLRYSPYGIKQRVPREEVDLSPDPSKRGAKFLWKLGARTSKTGRLPKTEEEIYTQDANQKKETSLTGGSSQNSDSSQMSVTSLDRTTQANTGTNQNGDSKTSNGQVTPSVDNEENQLIMEYQWLNEGHILISYIPCKAGQHLVILRWKGTDIKGSPFAVKIMETPEALNHNQRYSLGPKRVSFEGLARGLTAFKGFKSMNR